MHGVSGDLRLSQLYVNVIRAIEILVGLVVQEISSCKRDLQYWRALATSSTFEIQFTRWHISIYRQLSYVISGSPVKRYDRSSESEKKLRGFMRSSLVNSPNSRGQKPSSIYFDNVVHSIETDGFNRGDEWITADKDFANVEKNIFILRFDLQQLSCMLASIKEASEYLKKIYTEITITSQRTVTSRARDQPSFMDPALAGT